MNIPLCKPDITDDEIDAVIAVLKSGWLAHGPENEKLSKDFANYIGVKHAIPCNSCTSALYLALVGNDIKGEVLVPSFTWVASANVIVTAGAVPVFVDIDPNTFCISIEDLKSKINSKTEAIMPVHYAGLSSDMNSIMDVANEYNLLVIEDSAETIGGKYFDSIAGSFGIGCFSLYPTKNMTTGEGGILTTNDTDLANKVKALMSHGIETSTFEREKKQKPWIRAATYAGYNFRLCDILAAIGNVQLERLDQMNNKRRENSKYLIKKLEGVKNLKLPVEPEGYKHVYQMFVIQVNKKIRNSFVTKLRERGIGASVHFDPPVHKQPYYIFNFSSDNLDVTEEICDKIVTLPMYPNLTKSELDYIAKNVLEILQ